jgi:hypothetical protein
VKKAGFPRRVTDLRELGVVTHERVRESPRFAVEQRSARLTRRLVNDEHGGRLEHDS